MLEALKGMFVKFSVPQEIVDHPDVDPKALQPVFDAVEKSPQLTRTLKRRNLWVHGLVSMMDFVKIAPQCSVSDRADEIRCPTLVTWAENDPAAGFAESLYEALNCQKTLLRFTNDEGAGDHCEMTARTLFH